MKGKILKIVKEQLFGNVLPLGLKKILPKHHLYNDLDATEEDVLDIVARIESEFEIDVIPDEVIEKFLTVQDLIDYVKENE